MADKSAGLLLFRQKPNFQVLLDHPGASYWKNKHDRAWSAPKDLIEDGESQLEAAKREFGEEVGFIPEGFYIELGSIKQNGGQTVHAWVVEYSDT